MAQPEDGVTYAPKIDKAEARIDFSKSAVEVERQIRAFNPVPGAFFEVGAERIRVLAADVLAGWRCRAGRGSRRPAQHFLRRRCDPPRPPAARGPRRHDVIELLRGFAIPRRYAALLTRFALTVEYDGRPFMGWQRQAHGPSVQEAIETAAREITGETVAVHAAGRTDAGVHGTGMRAHVDIAKAITPFRLMEALNARLRPAPVAILACEVVPDDWHARFSCLARHYEYRIVTRRAPLTFETRAGVARADAAGCRSHGRRARRGWSAGMTSPPSARRIARRTAPCARSTGSM